MNEFPDPWTWEKQVAAFLPLHLDSVEREPGLYAFYFRNRCLYIGQSTNLRARLMQHYCGSHNRGLKNWIACKGERLAVRYKTVEASAKGKLAGIESALIRRLRPPYNVNT